MEEDKMQAMIIGVRDIRNKGDLAILKSEINFIQRQLLIDNVVTSIIYCRSGRVVEPSLNIQPAFIDAWVLPEKGNTITKYIKKLGALALWFFQILILPLQIFLAQKKALLPYRKSLYTEVIKSKNIFFTGGNQLMDYGSKTDTLKLSKIITRNLFLFGLLWQIKWLKFLNKSKIIGFPQSVGLFKTELAKWIVKKIVMNMELC